LSKIIPNLKDKYGPDFIIANAENSAHGMSVTERSLSEMMTAGVDFFTLGNHLVPTNEIVSLLGDKNWPLIRPLNWSPRMKLGDGYRVIKLVTKSILIVNLVGRVFMHKQHDDPFWYIDNLLDEFSLSSNYGEKDKGNKTKVDAIIVDWHAEATSEKRALGLYLDGRVSAVLGTHTHVPTADAQVLPKGTAYITDVGMVGVADSILGLDKQSIINSFLTQMTRKPIDVATGDVEVNFVVLEIDPETGLAKNIEKYREIVVS